MPKTPANTLAASANSGATLVYDKAMTEAAQTSTAWPFEEARKIVAKLAAEKAAGKPPRTVLFETGYGPSGLPHIGTFGEVARTTMVRNAFRVLTDDRVPTRLICFSDDMDGFRKVPGNVPNQEMLREWLDKPLTVVPSPFGPEYPSFAHHNNAMLRRFLDQFGFEYEFQSATDAYKSGLFDATLKKMLQVYDEVMAIMLPSLGEERRQTYSPLLPISPTSGKVLQVPLEKIDADAGTIVFRDPDTDKLIELEVTGGKVKCQWKADWAMRWSALGVDYEMAGKDLIDSVTLSSKICKVLGSAPPDGFNYELFLDEHNQKISKSKGNGLTITDWLTYASPESLSLYMFHKPRAAKKLYFDVIPKTVDDYLTYLAKFPDEEANARLLNPVWHIHAGNPPKSDVPISFGLLTNLVSASNAADKSVLWGFIRHHAPDAGPATHPLLDGLAGYAITFYHKFEKPKKQYRAATEKERAGLLALDALLAKAPAKATGEELQNLVYEVGKTLSFEPLRDWFKAIYEVLLGASKGPRFGSFIELYGIAETRGLIADGLAGKLLTAKAA